MHVGGRAGPAGPHVCRHRCQFGHWLRGGEDARGARCNRLINNPGLGVPRYDVTLDGFKRTFATNHLGPF